LTIADLALAPSAIVTIFRVLPECAVDQQAGHNIFSASTPGFRNGGQE
jgi:hypothetical protein